MRILKRNIYYMLVSTALLTVISCSENSLTLNSPNDATIDALISSENGLQQLLIGAYDAYQKVPANEYVLTELRSDNSRANTENGTLPAYNEYTDTSAFAETYFYWANNYKVISQTNYIIENQAVLISESGQTTLGEAYFLRALSHFNLVRAFRDIAYVDQVLTVDSFTEFPQIPESETYAKIAADFMLAIDLLDGANLDKIRASKGAATVLLAKAYLSQPTPNYASARLLLEPLVSTSNEYGYSLLTNFDEVFGRGGPISAPEIGSEERHSEIIFTIPYEAGADDAVTSAISADDQIESNAERFSFDMSSVGQSNGVNLITPDLLRSMNPIDQPGRFYTTVNEDFYCLINNVDLSPPAALAIDPVTLQPIPDETECGGFQATSDIDIDVPTYNLTIAGLPPTTDIFQNKFIPDGGNRSGNDWIVLRYADVLLLYAEAVMSGGADTSDPTALEAVNRVRERALLDPLTIVTRDALLFERRMEFVFENQRLYDLIRFDVAIDVLQDFSDEMGYNFEPTDIYLPFPTVENDVSGGFYN